MRSPVKQFESICQDRDELKWDGLCCPVSAIADKYNSLLVALQPFIEAAKQIPEGTSPDDTAYSVFPPLGLFVGDFYSLLSTVGRGD